MGGAKPGSGTKVGGARRADAPRKGGGDERASPERGENKSPLRGGASAALDATGGVSAGDDFLSKLAAAESAKPRKRKKAKKKTGVEAILDDSSPLPMMPHARGTSALTRATAANEWQRVWSVVQLRSLPGDSVFGVGELLDREPMLSLKISSMLEPHYMSLLDCYHHYADVTLPAARPGAPHPALGEQGELRNTDLHRLSENSWLQLCRDAKLIGDGPKQLLPTDVCLIFTAVNTRRAARVATLTSQGAVNDLDQGSIRAFTFSEFIEALVQFACKRELASGGMQGAAAGRLTTEHVEATLRALVEGAVLPHVRREDVRGFREALQRSEAITSILNASAVSLRAVHMRYASRGGERDLLYDDAGGLGLTLARYQEMVWEAGLIGRQLSRNMAKAAFVNALNAGDALAGLAEFVEIVVRLAHHLTPMTREDRVGAPPPPKKSTGPPEAPPLPPPMLQPAEDGVGVVFRAESEAEMLPKLAHVLSKLQGVAFSPEDLELDAVRTFVARKSPFTKKPPPPPPPPQDLPVPAAPSAAVLKVQAATRKMAPMLAAGGGSLEA